MEEDCFRDCGKTCFSALAFVIGFGRDVGRRLRDVFRRSMVWMLFAVEYV